MEGGEKGLQWALEALRRCSRFSTLDFQTVFEAFQIPKAVEAGFQRPKSKRVQADD